MKNKRKQVQNTIMGNQELEQEGGGIFTTTTTTVNHHQTAVNPITEHCSNSGSIKRRQLFPSLSPIPKKPVISAPSPSSSSGATAAAVVTSELLQGFKKIQLSSTPPLRRTISEPINRTPDPHFDFSKPHSPENLDNTQFQSSSAALPSYNLHRTVSDPTPALIFPHSPEINRKITPQARTPETLTYMCPLLSSELRRKVSDAMSSGEMSTELSGRESPNSKELKKLKEIFRVMNQWFSQAFQEEEEEETQQGGHPEKEGCEFDFNNSPKKNEDPEDEPENEIDEEAVSVNRIGEGLTIEFKCCCGKGYQILLSGSSCYYKLI